MVGVAAAATAVVVGIASPNLERFLAGDVKDKSEEEEDDDILLIVPPLLISVETKKESTGRQ